MCRFLHVTHISLHVLSKLFTVQVCWKFTYSTGEYRRFVDWETIQVVGEPGVDPNLNISKRFISERFPSHNRHPLQQLTNHWYKDAWLRPTLSVEGCTGNARMENLGLILKDKVLTHFYFTWKCNFSKRKAKINFILIMILSLLNSSLYNSFREVALYEYVRIKSWDMSKVDNVLNFTKTLNFSFRNPCIMLLLRPVLNKYARFKLYN